MPSIILSYWSGQRYKTAIKEDTLQELHPNGMAPFLPFLLLHMVLGQSLGFHWTERDKVEIIIKFKDSAKMSKAGNIGRLFGDYGNKYGLQWDEIDVTEKEGCKNKTGVEWYQAYIKDCNEFQKYLYDLKPRRYNIEMAHVICDRIAATICMARTCSPSEYKKMAVDSYECIHHEEGGSGGTTTQVNPTPTTW